MMVSRFKFVFIIEPLKVFSTCILHKRNKNERIVLKIALAQIKGENYKLLKGFFKQMANGTF